jgi:hypothetical protein
MTLAQACRRIERNEPPIYVITLERRNRRGMKLQIENDYLRTSELDVDAWRNLGRAMSNSPTLRHFEVLNCLLVPPSELIKCS